MMNIFIIANIYCLIKDMYLLICLKYTFIFNHIKMTFNILKLFKILIVMRTIQLSTLCIYLIKVNMFWYKLL